MSTATEYVYASPISSRNIPRGYLTPQAAASSATAKHYQTKINFVPFESGTVVRAPLDSSIVEQQMRMFMVERRGGSFSGSSVSKNSNSTSPQTSTPVDVPPLPERRARNVSPVVGLRRSPMVSKNSTPPAVRLGRRGSPPMKGASSISSTNEQASALSSREASPSQARSPQRLAVDTALQSRRSMSLEVEGNSPLTQRPRANTDTRVQYPPFGYMTPRNASPTPEYRPAVPEKDNIEHSRSRSLSPPALGKAKEEKPEKRRNVFGLFPSEKKDGSEKKGMANHIAAVFHRERKPSSSGPIQGAGSSSESAAMSSRSAPTPAPATYYTPPMMGLSPPQPWLNNITSPPVQQLGFHARKISFTHPHGVSRLPMHSRDNSASTTSSSSTSHFRNPSSALANAVWQADSNSDIDLDETMAKIWGTYNASKRSPSPRGSPRLQGKRNRSRTLNQVQNGFPNPSPLLPPVNKEAYRKRTLPAAPLRKPATVVEEELEPVEPLLPVVYVPDEVESRKASISSSTGGSSGFEPLRPIAMIPMSPKRLADRVSQRLSVSIPHVGRRINESTSAPGTPAEFYKAGEMRYYLELPTGLGEFQLDSALEAQEQDEDDILMWLDSLKVEEPAEAAPEKSDHSAPEQRPAEVLRPENAHPQGTPQLVIDAISPVGKEKAQSDNAKGSRPNSPSFIPRKPVPSGVPNNNLLSPPVPQQTGGMPSPPTPSDYSGAFQGRISFASSVGDAFKYDSYAEEVERLSWRSSSAASDLSEHVTVAGLRLHGIPASAAVTSSVTSSSGSSPQTNPGSTFSSPNPSDYSTTPSSGSLCRSDIDAILGAAPMKKSEPRFNVYIDDDASTGMLSSEIEAILLAQMRREEEESKQTQAERQRDDELDKEYIKRMEARRTRYVRGRNSQFEEDILFILKSEDIIF